MTVYKYNARGYLDINSNQLGNAFLEYNTFNFKSTEESLIESMI